MDKVFFDSWEVLARTLVVGVLAYALLVAFLRISGQRTLAKMNAFDLVVTVALGSTLASMVVSKDVALAQGALGFALLIGLQFAVSWTSVRAGWVRNFVTGEPRLLAYDGRLLEASLRAARVNREDVMAAIRAAGLGALGEARAVVLETDGSFSVLGRDAGEAALEGVRR